MIFMKDKYRRTPKYDLVRRKLISVAESGGTITYQKVAAVMGLPLAGCYMVKEIAQILGEISEDEHRKGRLMLTAVVTRASGKQGGGFFKLARLLGKLKDQSEEAKERFWAEEKARVYEMWGSHRNGRQPEPSAPSEG